MQKFCIILALLIVLPAFSQDFFESLETEDASTLPYELNGFMRGAFFAGRGVDSDELVQKSGYGELGLKMRVRKESWGDGYAEVRFRRGQEFNEPLSEFRLREAYVNTYLGTFDLRVGQQIVVWGRADGFNPTNNITPQDMTLRSSVEDDRRLGNFLFRGTYNFQPFNLEMIWVPQYRPSVLPTRLFPFPDFVRLGREDNPSSELDNSSVAAKLDMNVSALDGSISYFRGYMPLPGVFLHPDSIDVTDGFQATVVNKPYQMQVLGADFSTTVGSFGLRGEIAYRMPVEDYEDELNAHVPNPDLQYVLGMDRSMGNFSIIVQYIGRYVFDFTEFEGTGLPTDQLYITNLMISGQLDEMSHAVFMRPALTLRHETLDIELLGYYNVTTEETLLRPLIAYDITDAMTFKVGGEFYAGPENTLFGSIDKGLSSAFVELGVSF